jgi:hypothetical protein
MAPAPEAPAKSGTHLFRVSWAIGAGYYVTPQIGAHARYNAGLSSVYETDKSSVSQVGVEYNISQAKK